MKKLVVLLSLSLCCSAFAQTSDIWQDVSPDQLGEREEAPIQPDRFRGLALDLVQLNDVLNQAPREGSSQGMLLHLPNPDGAWESFDIFDSPIMEKGLADRYPEIKTYLAISRSSNSRGRIDLTPAGFHAMIGGPKGTWFIDPFIPGAGERAISYYRADLGPRSEFECLVDSGSNKQPNAPFVPIEGELLTYRIAMACTGEYATFHGGTVQLALAAIVTTMNRVNQVYETDFAIRMVLVANNDLLVYTNSSTDPYNNSSAGAIIGQNQTNIDAVIGAANYDIGHVVSTGSGGLASLGVVCRSGSKARGTTGTSAPIGDAFDIDYVAHELGHQWGGNHTFNGTEGACSGGNRNGSTAYEPGSGSTIMAYAGICGSQDLQPHSDPYFHGVSYDEIVDYSRNDSGSNCSVSSVVANQAPVVEAGSNYTIPQQTPFELTGSATDPDGDSMTYCWEEFDLGPGNGPGVDNGSSPIFRTWNPEEQPTRIFPRQANLLANTLAAGEVLPSTNRTLNFRLTVRDNHAGGGGVDFDSIALTVTTGSGPFLVTVPNTAVTLDGGQTETVTWNVAGTNTGSVSCGSVDILLSTDGGLTFDQVLVSGVANDGSQDVTIPNIETSTARIKVKCSDNIFFDISNTNFTIVPMLLSCTDSFEDWQLPTEGAFLDSNANGIIDVADLISCLFN